METVHILVGMDGFNNMGGFNMFGQRKLNQDAINGAVAVQLVYQGQQFILAGGGGQVDLPRMNSHLLAGPVFGSDIGTAGRIVTHQYDCQSRNVVALRKFCNLFGEIVSQPLRNGFSVDDDRHNKSSFLPVSPFGVIPVFSPKGWFQAALVYPLAYQPPPLREKVHFEMSFFTLLL